MTLPSWLGPAGLVLALGIGAGWFYDSGKRAAEAAELQKSVATDESTIKALNVALDSAEKKERGDSTKYAADSGNYAGLEKRLRAAEAQYAAHLVQDSTDDANDAQAPDTGVVAQTPPQPPPPGLVDSTLDAADKAMQSCSLLVLDCQAQQALLRKQLAVTKDERDAYKRETPTFLMRNEAAVCSATGIVGFVAGVFTGKHL